jgi:hypothetical protein
MPPTDGGLDGLVGMVMANTAGLVSPDQEPLLRSAVETAVRTAWNLRGAVDRRQVEATLAGRLGAIEAGPLFAAVYYTLRKLDR